MWQGRMVVSTEARNYKEQAGWIAKSQASEIVEGDVALTLRVFRPQKRGDLDNCVKVLVDSLKGVIFADDDQVVEIHAFLGDDKHNPRVEVEIKEL
jgi:crossover junction endodeoxyribonuclease RusA